MSRPGPGGGCETTRLPCGLQLVTESMPEAHSVAIGFWVGAGSRDESDERAGASHFLEHLLFKGTEARSAAAIAEAIDEVGGDCNAFTTKEYTTFYIRLLAEHLPLGLDILSDIMWEPALRPSDVDAERSVILDEILMHADEPAELAGERWGQALFPEHPLGRDTLGDAETVSATSPSDIREFFTEHYRPGNIVVAVAGNCRHDEVAVAVEERFRGPGGGARPRRVPPRVPQVPLVVVTRPTEQAHVVLGVRSVSVHDDSRWAHALLNHTLGGGFSSRLFQKIREERGLAYSVGSERAAYDDAGSLAIVVGTAPDYVDEVLRIASDELERLAEGGVTDRELAVAKGNLRAEVLLSAEDSGARMSRIGSSLLVRGEVLSVETILSRVESVGPTEVKEAAGAVAGAPKTLCAVGPFGEAAFDDVPGLVAAVD